MTLEFADQTLTLLPERAVWLADPRCLIVSDLHLGKSATFRARGIPVPEGETRHDLDRLGALVTRLGADRLVIAGDLVHAAEGLRGDLLPTLDAWLRETPAAVTLVIGNHDRRAGLTDSRPDLACVDTLDLGGLRIIHDPADLRDAGPAICGHLHPAVRVPVSPRRGQRVACFHLSGRTLALPGFGSFTGTHLIDPAPGDRVFLPVGDEVREWPPKQNGSRGPQ